MFGQKEVRMLIVGKPQAMACKDGVLSWFFSVGLDAAGKTTMLYKMKLGEVVTTIPTIGIYTYYR